MDQQLLSLVGDIAISPDNRYLAAGNGIWHIEDGRLVRLFDWKLPAYDRRSSKILCSPSMGPF